MLTTVPSLPSCELLTDSEPKIAVVLFSVALLSCSKSGGTSCPSVIYSSSSVSGTCISASEPAITRIA